MMKKVIGITTAMALTLGMGLLVYANKKDDKVVTQPVKIEASAVSSKVQDTMNNDMLDIMEENGYKDIANEARNGNYKAIDDFMNNITEEDYQKMIDMMEENGYGDMAGMMESIGREEMIDMHNSMGGAESCHGANGSVENTSSVGNYNGMMNGSL